MGTAMTDCNGTRLMEGDEVATATSSRRAGAGLRTGKVAGPCSDGYSVSVKLESGRMVARFPGDIVKVAR